MRICFIQDASTPVKRTQTESAADARINLTPLKRPRSDAPGSPAEDVPRKTSRRHRPLAETNAVRMSPRKSNQAPSTSTRGQASAETPRVGGEAARTREDGARTAALGAKLKDGLKRVT